MREWPKHFKLLARGVPEAVEAEALLSARILLREREGAGALMTDEVRQV